MPRRPANVTPRRLAESGFADSFSSVTAPLKSKTSPLVSVCLVLLGVIILLTYSFSSSGKFARDRSLSEAGMLISFEEEKEEFASRPECRTAVCHVAQYLQRVYGDSMNRVLHIGPSSCGVVLKLLKEEKLEAWGILPFDPKPPVHSVCENLIRKGLIRVADVAQPLCYKSRSFSLVLANDIVDTMTSRQLNVTLRELARVSSDSVVLLINTNAIQKLQEASEEGTRPVKVLKPRSRLWWQHRFQMLGLKESEEATKRFNTLMRQKLAGYHIFHLISTEVIG
ncbi:hypothetical protein KP509_21G072000 [Ceratopteris richardii]|nr:hypothetical protein KP509_21G072000 [Ceratopteris richardii]KAH7315953.1 hypothetical protein KP509_21G072000 [Ceratopteris richardii]KAH7315956.1 hypothetical protein KP509_21G072000 [Ceratopteris richardii]KAH7315957.1 hypothetical protein KP509_21G072000 [Ceratopteris richardii]